MRPRLKGQACTDGLHTIDEEHPQSWRGQSVFPAHIGARPGLMPASFEDAAGLRPARPSASMPHHGLRDVDEGRAAIRDAAAEIVVLVEQENVLIEAAEPQKEFATDEETGARRRTARRPRRPAPQACRGGSSGWRPIASAAGRTRARSVPRSAVREDPHRDNAAPRRSKRVTAPFPTTTSGLTTSRNSLAAARAPALLARP